MRDRDGFERHSLYKQLLVVQQLNVMSYVFVLFACVDVLRPCQQLRLYRAGQLPLNIVPGQAAHPSFCKTKCFVLCFTFPFLLLIILVI